MLKVERVGFKIFKRGFVDRDIFSRAPGAVLNLLAPRPSNEALAEGQPPENLSCGEVDRSIPLVDRYFGQHPIEKVAFQLDITREDWIDGIPWFPSDRVGYCQKLKDYNTEATLLNTEVVEKIQSEGWLERGR